MERLVSAFGLLCMIFIAYLLSDKKKEVQWKMVLMGVGLQIIFALLILKTQTGKEVFVLAKIAFEKVLGFSAEGGAFIFGQMADITKMGFVFATMVLPTIIFTSSLMSVLYHVGVMQKLVKYTAVVMQKTLGTSGSESLASAANIFAGQTEAPLVVGPYVKTMTRSEIMSLMTGGMATVAGGVLAAYVGMGIDAGHLLAASVMSAPAALVCAKIMVPETQKSETAGSVNVSFEKTTYNLVDAAAHGAGEGLKLALNVAGMLLAFIALIALLNGLLSWVGGWFGFPQLSFEMITGYLFAPFSFLMGVPWEDCVQVGSLLGKKMVINEFVAYLDLKTMTTEISARSKVIATYALCGFANFSSIAIQLGGIGTLAPTRRQDLASLGIKSMVAGTLACFMTACIAGLLI